MFVTTMGATAADATCPDAKEMGMKMGWLVGWYLKYLHKARKPNL